MSRHLAAAKSAAAAFGGIVRNPSSLRHVAMITRVANTSTAAKTTATAAATTTSNAATAKPATVRRRPLFAA